MIESLKGFVVRNRLWIGALVVAGVLAYGIKSRPSHVAVHRVEFGDVVAEVMGTGTLEARFQTTISSKIQGRLVEVLVDQNDKVTAGQLMARLDDAELGQEVGIAQATLVAAQATVKRLEAEDARARAVREQAQRDYQRYSSLVESKSISQENVEKTREKLEISEADVERAAATTTEAVRQVATAQEKLWYSEARLADTRIVSPFDALVVRRDRESGDIVVPGTSIFQIISLKEMWTAAWVDESAMAALAPGQAAWLVFRSEPKKRYRGSVARLGREVDRETREFRVDVKAEDLPANWAVGQRGEVYIETGRKQEVLVVPLQALLWEKGKSYVWLMDEGQARRREVVLGLRGIDVVEITKGLSEKDLLILPSAAVSLTDGQRVKSR
jgi:HlyD family secretion protein